MLEIKQKPYLHASWIDPDALEIVEKLQRAGFTAYLVGGCVRDLLAGIQPKDFDIATSALPQEVRKKIWGSYIIGRRFRLVLAKRNEQQFEIATFRRSSKPEDFTEGEDITSGDNFFGSPEEDALRRDFTVNALFYDPIKDQVIDFIQGLKDIENKLIHMIGDPEARIIEDPIRSLRALRLAHKLKFSIEPNFRSAIAKLASECAKSVLPRRREEYLKFFRLEDHVPAICELYDLNLMEHLLPTLKEIWDHEEKRNIFIDYLHRMEELTWNYKNPVEIYLPIVLAMIRTLDGDPKFELKLDQFMKNELGMFKSEVVEVLHSFDLAHNLPNVQSFDKKGSRRQSSFLQQPLLPFAFRIAKMENLFAPEEHMYWIRRMKNYL